MAGKPRTSREPRPIGRGVVRQRRIARTMMWVCFSLATISAALWAVSLKWTLQVFTPSDSHFGLSNGALYCNTLTNAGNRRMEPARQLPQWRAQWRWSMRRRSGGMYWWPPLSNANSSLTYDCHAISLVAIAAPATLGAFFARRWLRRLPRPDQCPACGYSTHGLPAGVCPECGRPLPPSDCFPQI